MRISKRVIARAASVGLAGVMVTVFGAAAADAQPRPWSVSFDVGALQPLSGDVHGSGSGTVLGLPAEVTPKSYGDIYGTAFNWTAAFGYGVGSRGEVRVEGGYAMQPAENIQVGTVAGLPLFGRFDDYKSFDMNFGYRHYLGDGSARPFVRGAAGFSRLSTVNAEFSVPAAGVVLPNVPFYAASFVPAFVIGGGVHVALSDRIGLQGSLDVRWRGDQKDEDGLAGTGLEPINDQSRAWSMPISGGVTLRF